MNVDSFFKHYQLLENPFRAEEARQDAVFSRIEQACHHPDYAKFRGDFQHPASAIVFGERGSGKTAIRMQVEHDLAEHNRNHPEHRCLGINYDELNPVLDRLHQRKPKASAEEVLAKMRLSDHIDGMLSTIVPRIVDQAFKENRSDPPLEVEGSFLARLRMLDPSAKRDLLLLQACYDRPEEADLRTGRLRRGIRAGSTRMLGIWRWSAGVFGVLGLGTLVYYLLREPDQQPWLWMLVIAVLLGAAVISIGRFGWLWFRINAVAAELARTLRVVNRSTLSFRKSLASLHPDDVLTGELPSSGTDDAHFAMLQRLQRVIRPLGYRSIIVLFDRVDEPTMVNGEPARMRSVVWPMLNNKFLQHDGFGVKMLLPLDLKHLLDRESQQFFREARLDKQNLIDRLTWSGAMLYDLCTARVNACRQSDAQPFSLTDFFDDSVTHQDLVDALDQMQQPRDAFKLMYSVIQEHCAGIPEETPQWKVPKLVLDNVRRNQVDRLSGMLRGTRPA
jgi:hypothetical protein